MDASSRLLTLITTRPVGRVLNQLAIRARQIGRVVHVTLPSVPAGLFVEAWPPMLAVRGPGMCRTLHSHHAMHFVLAVDGELGVRTRDDGRWIKAAGVLTAPGIPHAIDARGHDQVLIFLDPESDAGAMLRPALSGPLRLTSKAERAKLVRGVEDPQLFASADGHEWLRQVAETLRLPSQEAMPVLHPAVRALLERCIVLDGGLPKPPE